MRRFLYTLIVMVAVALLFFALRVPLLRSAADFLVDTDALHPSDVIFVLSGNAYDRGLYAARLYNEQLAPRVVCTGGNPDGDALALGRNLPECELTRAMVRNCGIDSNAVIDLPKGTSTYEEALAIDNYCKQNDVRSCIVVTSVFHTRRVAMTMKRRLKKDGIDLMIAGAPPRMYDVNNWWKNEYGLIDLNNEYVKLVYYLVKGF